MLHVVL